MTEVLINSNSIPVLVEDSEILWEYWNISKVSESIVESIKNNRFLPEIIASIKTINPKVPDLERTSYLGE